MNEAAPVTTARYKPGPWVGMAAAGMWVVADLDPRDPVVEACWALVTEAASVDEVLESLAEAQLRPASNLAVVRLDGRHAEVRVRGKAWAEIVEDFTTDGAPLELRAGQGASQDAKVDRFETIRLRLPADAVAVPALALDAGVALVSQIAILASHPSIVVEEKIEETIENNVAEAYAEEAAEETAEEAAGSRFDAMFGKTTLPQEQRTLTAAVPEEWMAGMRTWVQTPASDSAPTSAVTAVVGPQRPASVPAVSGPPASAQVASRQVQGGLVQGGQVQGGGLVQGGLVQGGQVQRGGLVQGGHVQGGQVQSGQVQGGQVQSGQVQSGQVQGGLVQGGLVQGGFAQGGGLVQDGQVQGGAPAKVVAGGGDPFADVSWAAVAEERDAGPDPYEEYHAAHPVPSTYSPPGGDGGIDPELLQTVQRPPSAPATGGPVVDAVRCDSGHLNPPNAGRCRICGGGIAPQTPQPVPRPKLGALRLSTKEVVPLDRGVILGRAPGAPEGFGREEPYRIQLPSPDGGMSRKHVEVVLDGWTVTVVDLKSTNGTQVIPPGGTPETLPPGGRRVIDHGWTVSLDSTTYFRFEVTE